MRLQFLRAIWKTWRRAPLRPPRVPQMAPRWKHFAIWAAFCTLFCLGGQSAGWRWSSFFDASTTDSIFNMRGAHEAADVAERLPQSRHIVIVELRHDTPRDVLALLLPKLKLARAVGLDMMFADHKSQLSRDELPLYKSQIAGWKREDARLASAIRGAGNLVIGAWSEQESTDPPTGARWHWPAAPLRNGARATCHLGVVPDVQDGIIRRVHLWETIEGKPVPALGLALAALYRGQSPQELSRLAAQQSGPLPRGEGALLINYLGPRVVWEYDTNRIVFERALEAEPEDFAGKIVLVGQTDVRSKDIFPTPFGDMPGLFIHANLVATLLDPKGPPRPLAPPLTALISLVLCLFLVATLAKFPVWICAPVALLEMLLAAALAGLIFTRGNAILPLSVPLGALFWTYNGIALYEYRRARGTLGRVVGIGTAAQLLDDLQNPHLGGKLEIATAFFCDLRGYSSFSETLAPEELIALLNLYTAAVVREVQAQGGRAIDFFGDGVFALFEAQTGSKDASNHARRAILAALATQNAIAAQMAALQNAVALDSSLSAAAQTPLSAGIALHTGPMVIGLVGAENHIKPGAVGDAVNVAARLQSLSESAGFPILLSRATLEAGENSGETFGATFCGQFPIKGRQGLVEVFGLGAN